MVPTCLRSLPAFLARAQPGPCCAWRCRNREPRWHLWPRPSGTPYCRARRQRGHWQKAARTPVALVERIAPAIPIVAGRASLRAVPVLSAAELAVRQSPQPVLARPILVQAAMAAQAPAPRTLGRAVSRAGGAVA